MRGSHNFGQCSAYGKICSNCGGKNHFNRICNKSIKNIKLNEYNSPSDEYSDADDYYEINNVHNINDIHKKTKLWHIKIYIENKKISAQLDSGSDADLMPINIFKLLKIPMNKIKKLILSPCVGTLIFLDGPFI